MEISNQQLAKLLRNIAAALTIKKIGNIFQIRAYENAASSIEHSTVEVQDLWQEGKLSEIPSLGAKLQEYLNELFTKGSVEHFAEIKKGIPKIVFELLDISGIGPKTAQELASLGIKDLADLKKKIKSGELVNKGFSAKIAQNIMQSLQSLGQRENRMLLPYAFLQADKILNYLKANSDVLQTHFLGSLRRMVATIGDLDFAVSSNRSKEVVEYFCQMPGVSRIVDKGGNQHKAGTFGSKATVVLKNGVQADLLVGKPESYGALLQHFTGSKSHNIKLRELANQMGYSLSEYGVKRSEDGKITKTEIEEELYNMLGMQVPPPEIREDKGEIEAALEYKLPKLVQFEDIKGDLHTHSNFPLESSHGPGVNSIEDIVKKAEQLGYIYIGISDHSPAFTTHSLSQIAKLIQKRTKIIQYLNMETKSIHILNGLEIDILGDGSLSVPDEVLTTLDYCIAGIHSGHRGTKEEITNRLIKALENPHVDIISHPTNRLLNKRDSSEALWEEIFKLVAQSNKILEINAHPIRLDLREDLVRQALGYGVKFIINTDAHEVSQMDNMRFGVAVARRGWATSKAVVNTWDWTEFAKWFKLTV